MAGPGSGLPEVVERDDTAVAAGSARPEPSGVDSSSLAVPGPVDACGAGQEMLWRSQESAGEAWRDESSGLRPVQDQVRER